MIRYLLILLFCTPTYAATYKLVERNGDLVTEKLVASVTIPRDSVVVVVPDRIFADTEFAALLPQRSTGAPRPTPRGNEVNASTTEPRGKGSRKDRGLDAED